MGGMIRVKPRGHYGRAVDESRFLRFLRPADDTPARPDPIAADAWRVEQSAELGGYLVTVDAFGSLGDAAYFGDGAGVLLDVEYRAGDLTGSLGLVGPGTAPLSLPPIVGQAIPVQLRVVGTAGVSEWSDTKTVLIELAVWPDDESVWPTAGEWPGGSHG